MEELDIDYDAPIDPWTFSIEGVQCSWSPEYPYISSDESDVGNTIIQNINNFLDMDEEDDLKEERIVVPPTGPDLLNSTASPYSVLFAIMAIYGDTPELISFSENAPKWTDIDPVGPGSEDEDIYN